MSEISFNANSLSIHDKPNDPALITAMRVSISSPEQIKSWSFGQVKKHETINYRTFKPERDGLFCGKIFGPVKNYECVCGKYKRKRHEGVVCEKCGVEVTVSDVRRERMGHIELATPVAHIWFLKSLPSRIGNMLDLSLRDLEKVLYFESYIITDPGKTDLEERQLLTDKEYREALTTYGTAFKAAMGAEAIKELLAKIDVKVLANQLLKDLQTTSSDAKRKKISKRLKVVYAMLDSGNRPEWMILDVIPVLPPDLRPLVPLDVGRMASSDLNDLYRRVLNRNNRLKRLLDISAPDIIIRNEKRMLQEAVDALFDNGRRGRIIQGANKRPLKSLSDMLKGKTGRFRQNLLGKRVDYSGRSVITVGPDLRLHQCGLPKQMALELFKPFIYNRLIDKGFTPTVKGAKKMVDSESAPVWDALAEVVLEHPVMLNRAPTLHRLGIQAFEPVLIEGKALRLHPLVCAAFNADFDGDQMAVHVPLSIESQVEARVLMMSTNNILSPASGKPIINPSQDMVLGLYYMTRERPFAKGEGKVFSNRREVMLAVEEQKIDLQAKIKVRIAGKLWNTTPGRVILYDIFPRDLNFEYANKVFTKKEISKLIDICFREFGNKATVLLADRLKDTGYMFATRAGISIAMVNMVIPESKTVLLKEAEDRIASVEGQYQEGLITAGERYNKVVDIWADSMERVAKDMMVGISTQVFKGQNGEKVTGASFNSIFMMADSGARGSSQQIRQLAGMRGLMARPDGSIIETPIKANFREGLTVAEYFISTHGARKGLADTALKTASSGHLTRRLVDVAQDCVITGYDCCTLNGVEITALIEGGEEIESLQDRILGRVSLDDILDPISKEVLVKANAEITEELAKKIVDAGIDSVMTRSVLTCEMRHGVCALCYGRDLARGHLVSIGEAVGVIAAQSIGEPGTQLTMRTFHVGGTATGKAEQTNLLARYAGTLQYIEANLVKSPRGWVVMGRKAEVVVVDQKDGRERERHALVYGAVVKVTNGALVKAGDLIAEWDPFSIPLLTEHGGRVQWNDINEQTVEEKTDERTGFVVRQIKEVSERGSDLRPSIIIKSKGREDSVFFLPVGIKVVVDNGTEVFPGDILAKRERETTKTKDITGGLPRVAELFEARKPKNPADISDIDGIISFGEDSRGKRRVIVTPEVGETAEYLISKNKHLLVHEGDKIRAGEPITSGAENPHDILKIQGLHALVRYLVNEVQEVYKLQGVRIDDKHIEVIVRQMLGKVQIVESGKTRFLAGETVDRFTFNTENERVLKAGLEPATYEPVLLGITKAALTNESFISAASFQETTKVLTDAAIGAKTDYLRGLKENVIMGRLIPAGTGFIKRARPNTAVEVEGQIDEPVQQPNQASKISLASAVKQNVVVNESPDALTKALQSLGL
ncbi:MAG: DNA-directed RNA polymerase subunit beta' [Deltaproteobacteria bacterium]|jgi:DNA-directed RNA polymerase subunit beta'|nr:DNA-directed RNA polymerase subunit beta' [Deltaproteobacteria bacterium]